MSDALTHLAAAHRERAAGEAVEAERLYRDVLERAPDNTEAARALGEMLLDSLRLEDALAVICPATSSRPDDAGLLLLLGRCLFLSGQISEASRVLEYAHRADPRLPGVLVWLAKCWNSSNRHAEAEALLRSLLASNPSDPLVFSALGQACVALGKRQEAVTHYRTAVQLESTATSRSDLGYALYVTDQLNDALVEFEAALALDPKSVTALGGKAMILADQDAGDEARRIVQKALDQGLLDTVLATTFARLSKASDQRPEALRVLERALARPDQNPADRASLLMALGSLREADREYDAAFECFRTGNDLLGSGFNESAMRHSMQEMMGVFNRANMDRLPRSLNRDPLPIFIVGMPRSGTSLVEQILASHPAVYGAGELLELGTLAHSVPGQLGLAQGVMYPQCIPALTQMQLDTLARIHLDRLRDLGKGAERVTDKMPLNFAYLGLIDLLFPGARIIHCVRHPLDTCVSLYTTPMNQAHSYRTRLRDLVAVYRTYRGIMDHWRPLLRVPMLDVCYEDLVAEPERLSRTLVEFVGLPWDPRCLSFHETRRVVRTASTDQVRRPVYNSSVNRWRHYERHIGELIAGLRDYC